MKRHSKTLVVQPQLGIGDFMWFIRHLHAIAEKTPEKKVTLLARPRSQARFLIQEDPYIEEVIYLEVKPGIHDGIRGLWKLARLLKSYKFRDMWILHSQSLRYPLVGRLAGISHLYGPGKGLQKYFLNSGKMLTVEEQKTHPLSRGTRLLEKNGIPFLKEKRPLRVPPSKIKEIEKSYKPYKKPWICLGISSNEVPKKWPTDRYIQLAEKISKETKGTFFILGGVAEQEEGAYVLEHLKAKKIPAVLAIGDLWASLGILSLSKFIVGNDTGITNAAPMVGSQGLVLIGNTPPIHHYAPLEGVRAGFEGDTQVGSRDMDQITVTQVFAKLKSLGWVP
jgi:heptosyltransferase-2